MAKIGAIKLRLLRILPRTLELLHFSKELACQDLWVVRGPRSFDVNCHLGRSPNNTSLDSTTTHRDELDTPAGRGRLEKDLVDILST
jgi:hypothetical protein